MKKQYSDLQIKMHNISMEEKIATTCGGGSYLPYINLVTGCNEDAVQSLLCFEKPYGNPEQGQS